MRLIVGPNATMPSASRHCIGWHSKAPAALAVLAATTLVAVASGADNGLALLPPMGWRNFWLMAFDVDQAKMEHAFAKMVERKRTVVGGPAHPQSFADLGYVHAGLDDGWQACGTGVHGSFHDANGYPLVNETLFPNMTSMVATGRALGLLPGWCEQKSLAL